MTIRNLSAYGWLVVVGILPALLFMAPRGADAGDPSLRPIAHPNRPFGYYATHWRRWPHLYHGAIPSGPVSTTPAEETETLPTPTDTDEPPAPDSLLDTIPEQPESPGEFPSTPSPFDDESLPGLPDDDPPPESPFDLDLPSDPLEPAPSGVMPDEESDLPPLDELPIPELPPAPAGAEPEPMSGLNSSSAVPERIRSLNLGDEPTHTSPGPRYAATDDTAPRPFPGAMQAQRLEPQAESNESANPLRRGGAAVVRTSLTVGGSPRRDVESGVVSIAERPQAPANPLRGGGERLRWSQPNRTTRASEPNPLR